MLKSMTGYGRAQFISPLGRLIAEIQSVNRKHLEINIDLPRELGRFDTDVRKWINSFVRRGQINVKISAYFELTLPMSVRPNLPLARQLKKSWDLIFKDLGIESRGDFSMLAGETDLLIYEALPSGDEEYQSALHTVIEEAASAWNAMRLNEGAELQNDIVSRLDNIEQATFQIQGISPQIAEKYRQKLLHHLSQVLPEAKENEERVLREVCLFADRIDITEELTRLLSHIKQTRHLLKQENNESVGKTLEFLVQEMNREINTIGSKSVDVMISQLVVEAKTELERIREQIQNVE